jgi:predicted DNA binding CopG/RHH family protein
VTALYSLYDALVSINVPSDKARAVVDAMERDMTIVLATKEDMKLLRSDLRQLELAAKADLKLLEQKIDNYRAESRTELHHEIAMLRSSMTIRLGSMLAGAIVILFTALRLTGG